MTSLAKMISPRRRLRISRRPAEAILPAMPRSDRRDCQGRLLAALLGMAGTGAEVEDASLRPWSSATFLGAQHRITLRLTGADAMARADAMAAQLAEAEFTIPRHIVVDMSVDALLADDAGDALLTLAVLTIEDW